MMHPNTLYHIFNRGNQRQKIFFHERNYFYFLEKIRKAFKDDIHVIAFCLMPNHFHIMASTAENFENHSFSKRLAIMLRSYTRGIQIQEKFVGSLFQQNTKKKELPFMQDATNCFHYIHQNPVHAKLVDRLEFWQYSSFNEYLFSTPDICNIKLGRELLDLSSAKNVFYKQALTLLNNKLNTAL